MGAPLGNTNGRKENRLFGDTLRRVAAQDADAVRQICETLVAQAKTGDIMSIREVADRLDGKPKQQTELTGAEGGPLAVSWKSDAG